MKKHVWKATMKKVLSCLLVASFVVSMFAGIPKRVSAATPADVPTLEKFELVYGKAGTFLVNAAEAATAVNETGDSSDVTGIRVTAGPGSESQLLRTKSGDQWFTGLHMEISDVTATGTNADDYAVVVHLGNLEANNDPNTGSNWRGGSYGYYVWYNADGKVAIYKIVKGAQNTKVAETKLKSFAELKAEGGSFVLDVKPVATDKTVGNYKVYNWEVTVNSGAWETTIASVNDTNNGGVFAGYQGAYVKGISIQVLPSIGAAFPDSQKIGDITYNQYTSTAPKKKCTVSYLFSKFDKNYVPVTKPDNIPDKADFVGEGAKVENKINAEKVQQGITATLTKSANQYIYAKNTYSFLNGFRIDLKDIQEKTATDDKDYSVAWAIGKAEDGKMWYDDEGYMFVYGYSGNFAIVKTAKDGTGLLSNNVVYQDTLASLEEVKELFFYIKEDEGGKWSIYLSTYDANGNVLAHTAVATLDAVDTGDAKAYHIGLGAMGDFAPVENDKLAGLELTNTGSDVSFGLYHMADSEPIENVRKKELTGKEAGMGATGASGDANNIYFREAENGVQVVVKQEVSMYGRVNLAETFTPEDQMKLSLKEITTRNEDYTFLVSISDAKSPFYNTRGYSIKCTKAGDVTIYRTRAAGDDVSNPTLGNSKIVCEGKLDQPIDGELMVDVKLIDENYNISLNGKVFTVPASDPDYPLGSTKVLYASVGIFSNKNYQVSYIVEKESKEEITGDFVDASELGLSYWTTQEYPLLFQKAEGGAKVISRAETPGFEKVTFKDKFIPADRMHIEITDIDSKSDNYSLAVAIGDSKTPFYNTRGYMIIYGKSGNFSIVQTKQQSDLGLENRDAQLKDSTEVIYEKREPLGKNLTIDVKLKSGIYHITVNGKTYEIPAKAETHPMWTPSELYASVAVLGDGRKNNIGITLHKSYPVSFVLKVEEKETVTGNFVKASEVGLSHWSEEEYPLLFEKAEGGAKVISRPQTKGWEKATFQEPFMPADRMHIEITDITSKSENYSMAVAIGDSKNAFYNTRGYMIIYGKSGNFSIIQTKAKEDLAKNVNPSPNNSIVVVKEVREALGSNLTVDVKLKSGIYHITVNGKTYEVPAKAETHPMWTPSVLYASVAVMSDGEIGDINVGEYKSYPLSFVLKVEEKEVITDVGLDKETLKKQGISVVGENYIISKAEEGLKVINKAEAQGWERIVYQNRFSPTGNGMGVEITDITSKSDNYSLAVMLGESENPFYNTRGYMIIYGKSGNFTIIATDASAGTPKKSAVVVAEVREPLGDKLSVNVKIQADIYRITVNGKVYEIPVQHSEYPISNPRKLYMALGVMGDGALQDISVGRFKSYSLSFVIKKVLGKVADGAEMPNEGEPFGFYVSGFHQYLGYAKQGVKITRKAKAASWERVTTLAQFDTNEGGVQIELNDISSKDSNYSVAVMLGNKKDDWSDSTGYMLIYGKSGKFAIIATDSTVIDPNVSPIIFQEDREELGNAMSINVRLTEDDEYKITVNGRTYTVEAEHKDYKLEDVEKLNIGFGAYDNTEAGKWIIDSDWMKSPLTYTVASVQHTTDIVTGIEVNPTEEKEKTDKPASKPDNNSRPVVNEEPKEIPWLPIISVSAVIVLGLALGGIVIYRKKIRRQ